MKSFISFPYSEKIDFIRNNKKYYNKINSFLIRYKWLPFEYGYGDEYDFKDIVKRMVQFLEDGDPSDKLKKMEQAELNLPIDARQIINELKLSPFVKRFITIYREYVYLRNKRLEYYSESGNYVKKFFLEIGRRINLSYNDLFYLTGKEIRESLINNNVIIPNNIIRDRKNAYGFLLEKGKLELFQGEGVVKIDEVSIVYDNINELSGDIANGGFAQGRARIVLGEEDFFKVNKGDVVIVVITTPKFNPILEISSAVVADIGGMTSHTAKIARELGIPCIIGTKIGTQVFKDGDLLKVDAEKGKVIKIK